MTERVLCAAIWVETDKKEVHQPVPTGYVIAGWRHHNCLDALYACTDGETVLALRQTRNRLLY